MDSDQKFWLTFWTIAGGTLGILALILFGTMNEFNKRKQQRALACIEQGGTWVDTSSVDTSSVDTCVLGKR